MIGKGSRRDLFFKDWKKDIISFIVPCKQGLKLFELILYIFLRDQKQIPDQIDSKLIHLFQGLQRHALNPHPLNMNALFAFGFAFPNVEFGDDSNILRESDSKAEPLEFNDVLAEFY